MLRDKLVACFLLALVLAKCYLGRALNDIDLSVLIGSGVGLAIATAVAATQNTARQSAGIAGIGLVYGLVLALIATIGCNAFVDLTQTWVICVQITAALLGGWLATRKWAKAAPQQASA